MQSRDMSIYVLLLHAFTPLAGNYAKMLCVSETLAKQDSGEHFSLQDWLCTCLRVSRASWGFLRMSALALFAFRGGDAQVHVGVPATTAGCVPLSKYLHAEAKRQFCQD